MARIVRRPCKWRDRSVERSRVSSGNDASHPWRKGGAGWCEFSHRALRSPSNRSSCCGGGCCNRKRKAMEPDETGRGNPRHERQPSGGHIFCFTHAGNDVVDYSTAAIFCSRFNVSHPVINVHWGQLGACDARLIKHNNNRGLDHYVNDDVRHRSLIIHATTSVRANSSWWIGPVRTRAGQYNRYCTAYYYHNNTATTCNR